jgi:hypothetical protein
MSFRVETDTEKAAVPSVNDFNNTIMISKDNAAARRRLRRRIINTSRKLTTQPTKLAEESLMV